MYVLRKKINSNRKLYCMHYLNEKRKRKINNFQSFFEKKILII
jgi:hypothetical protein